MNRRDMVQNLLQGEPRGAEPAGVAAGRPRVASGAVRAMGLELDRLNDEARQASELRERLAAGGTIVELDPNAIGPSFMSDRLLRTGDAEYRDLVESIRTSGQLVPILVRPHPTTPDRYEVAYGHRRRDAALELGIPVKAIVRRLSDQELVVAQGVENAERRNLSFIERATFAAAIEARGFPRATINAALGVSSAETSRLISVAVAVPSDLVQAIGPAPKAGRPRWLELAKLVEVEHSLAQARHLSAEPSFARLPSDRRFDRLIDALRAASGLGQPMLFHNNKGEVAARAERFSRAVRLSIDDRIAPGLADRLLALIPALLDESDAPPLS